MKAKRNIIYTISVLLLSVIIADGVYLLVADKINVASQIIVGAVTVVLLIACIPIVANISLSAYYKLRVIEFKSQNKTFQKGQIVFVGDSITDLCDLDKYYKSERGLKLYNRGINGDTTKGLIARLDVSVGDIAPERIFLLIGVNDMGKYKLSKTVSNYDHILDYFDKKLPGTPVFCQSIYPIGKGRPFMGNNAKIRSANDCIKELCKKHKCTYIEVHKALTDEKGYLRKELSLDKLHPNNTGYVLIAPFISSYIDKQ